LAAVSNMNVSVSLKVLKRVVKKQRPIAFRCWDLTVLRKGTEMGYYSSIFYYTVTLLVLFESTVDKLVSKRVNQDAFNE